MVTNGFCLAVLLLGTQAGCGIASDSSVGSSDGEGGPTLLTKRELPPGFPADEVPVLAGRIVSVKTGKAAGAPRGREAWAVRVQIDDDLDECFKEAVEVLHDRGLLESQAFTNGPGRQAMFKSKSDTVILTALDRLSADCTLWYSVGDGELNLAG
jgi:hypothetical protein